MPSLPSGSFAEANFACRRLGLAKINRSSTFSLFERFGDAAQLDFRRIFADLVRRNVGDVLD